MQPTLSVLMCIYHGTTREELARSIDCIFAQTRTVDEFLVVVDGPVSPPLDTLLAEAAAQHPQLRIERLPHNVGSGAASAFGLRAATGDYVARHDSDDISVPHRLEEEMRAIAERGLDIVGSTMLEFEGSPKHVVAHRRVPLSGSEIAARARLNNPINNPTVVFRRQLALDAGGYADLRYMQDYDLFARMLAAGGRAENLAEPLVLFNAGAGMMRRRAGWQMVKLEWVLQRRLLAAGITTPAIMVRNVVLRSAFRLLPHPVLRTAYGLIFRRRVAEADAGATA